MNQTLQNLFDKNKSLLNKKGIQTGTPKTIAYGLQFPVTQDDTKGIIRIYNSKKGVKIDLSQIHHTGLKGNVAVALQMTEQIPTETKTDDVIDTSLPMIGTDESGKGDYFGPLSAAAVYYTPEDREDFIRIGVKDCKEMSDKSVIEVSEKLKETVPYSTFLLMPEQYNEEYEKKQNLNHLLAYGHQQVISQLNKEVKSPIALIDQFCKEDILQRLLKDEKMRIIQRPRAEAYPAVAAASIIARAEFLKGIEFLSDKIGVQIPKGNSPAVTRCARGIFKQYGPEKLKCFVKLHFKTTEKFHLLRKNIINLYFKDMTDISVTKEEAENRVIIRLSGEIGLSEEYSFKKTVSDALAAAPKLVIIDLQKVIMLSSYGIATLISIWKQQSQNDSKTVIVCPKNHVYDSLSISGTDKIIPIFETEEEAKQESAE